MEGRRVSSAKFPLGRERTGGRAPVICGRLGVVVYGLAFLAVLSGTSSLSTRALAAEVRQLYRFGRPVLDKGSTDARTGTRYQRVRIPGLGSYGAPGQPVLPSLTARLLLPGGEEISEITVRPGTTVSLPGRHAIESGRAEHSPFDDRLPENTPPDPAIYDSSEAWPGLSSERIGVGKKHGRSVLLLRLHPVQYVPKSGEIRWTESLDVRVRTRPKTAGGPLPLQLRARPSTGTTGSARLTGSMKSMRARRSDLARLVDNGEGIGGGDGGGDGDGDGGGAGGGGGDIVYAIITSPELAPGFEALASDRTAQGFPGQVFTTDTIYAAYDGQRPDGGSDNATRIRNFIVDLYQNRGLRYVLLGGDADGSADCDECEDVIVPARYFQSQELFSDRVPADMYYGCLDGSFDADADGLYGEPNDGPGGSDVDLLFEVQVGRAPVDSRTEVGHFVRKTLAYERSAGPVLRDVLLIGERLGFGGEYDFGGNLNDQIRDGSNEAVPTLGFATSSFDDFFRVSTIYDRDSFWTPRVLTNALEAGVHIVNHVGHADITNVMKLTNTEIDGLTNQDYFIGYSQSCYAGAFDNQRTHGSFGGDSVVEHLLTSPGGAVAFVANGRRGWASTGIADGPSQRFNRVFWHVVFSEGTLQLARANDRSKEENIGYVVQNPRARSCAYELNTLGDPLLSMRLAGSRGTLSAERPFYNPGEEMAITVIDADPNLSPDASETLQVRVRTVESGDELLVDLVESGTDSGVFRGTIVPMSGAAVVDTLLQVDTPETLLITYTDADDGSGAAASVEIQVRVVQTISLVGDCPPHGSVGVPYRGQLAAAGGLPPYRFRAGEGYREDIREPFFLGIGYAQGWDADDSFWTYALPFPFPFYGETYEVLHVSSNGFLEFSTGNARDFANSPAKLIANVRIAPLWADLVTAGGGDIYVREQIDSVFFRWSAESYQDGENASVEVELFRDGTIRFGYGVGNTQLAPTIGISAGDGVNFVLSRLSGVENLSQAPAVFFVPTRPPDGFTVVEETGEVNGLSSDIFSGEVAYEVRDSLGQIGARLCRLDILPDGFTVLSPTGSSLPWLAGSDQTILWRAQGDVGETLRIDYNTTGSETDFPLTIATSVPVESGRFVWDVPDIRAETVRVRIRSVELPQFFTYSEVFSIVGPTLVLRVPNGGERWIVDGEALVGWESIGDTGTNVRIDYNTDGSTESFPLTLTPSVSNAGVFRGVVPATPSETCRLRIRSVESPAISDASADVFAIRMPSILLTSPNGGECLRAGAESIITWQREGQTGAQVLLDFNTDGSSTSFPFTIGGGPVPNSGNFVWTVPFDVSPTCRVRVRSVEEADIADASDNVFAIENRCGVRVLIWVPFVPQGAEQVIGVVQALAQASPDFEPFFSVQTTPEALRTELEDKDAMIIPRQKRDFQPDFESLGRNLEPVLRDFMARGGAIVICEQTFRSEAFLRSTGFLTFEHIGRGTRLCETIDPAHPLAVGVRPNFGGPISTSWYDLPLGGVDHVIRAADGVFEGGTVVASRDVGFGRLSFLGFDYYDFNNDTARILSNATRVTLPEGAVRLTSPDEGSAFQVGQQVQIRWFALGEARGPVRITYNTTGSTELFPDVAGEGNTDAQGQGSFLWTAPTPAAEDGFLQVRLRIESLASPEHIDTSSDPFFVVRPFVFATTELPEASVGLLYEARVELSGGVPPYEFAINNVPRGMVTIPDGPQAGTIRGLPQEPCPNCELEVNVRDSIGLSTRAFIPLPVVTREIRIIQPDGRNLLLFGSPYRILWRTSGVVGETVNLYYNIDGNSTEFPRVIAESVPIEAGELTWDVPGLTAPDCRLRIQSNEFRNIEAVSSETFSIVGPTIRLVSPTADECWPSRGRRRIQWQSVGNEKGTVRIAYNITGSDTDLPLLVADGLPNTGEYSWDVPDIAAEQVRLRITFENAEKINNVSSIFKIGPDCGVRVVLWTPCDVDATNVNNIVSSIDERVSQLDLTLTETRNPAEFEPLLANQDAIIVPLMSICQTLEYENLGASFRPALASFVEQGGVVIFCAPSTFSSRLMAGLVLLDRLRIIRSQGGLPSSVISHLHPIVRDVPLDFSGPFSTSSYSLIASSLEPVVASEEANVVSALDEGFGRWVLLGFNYQVVDDVSAQLLVNSLRMEPQRDGIRVLSPRPGQVYAAGEPLRVEWAARGKRSGTIQLRYNTTGTTQAFPLPIADVESSETGGSFEWSAPMPPQGEFLTLALEARWLDAPVSFARSEAPFFITELQLSIETKELEAGRLGAAFEADVRTSGGVAPFRFDHTGLPAGLFLDRASDDSPVARIVGTPIETVTDFPITIEVIDALGTSARQDYIMKVLPSRLILLSPSGGEFLLTGAKLRVDWEVRGYVGKSLRVEYNTTGSAILEDFDQVAAESVPVTEPFVWTLPDIESDRIRLRIVSNELDYSSITAEAFTISGPDLTCFFPNGLEALDTGSLRTIRWRSLGNPSGRVTIELLREDSAPEIIASDTDDTGTFVWSVPDDPCESCRVRITSTDSGELTDVSDDPFSIRFNNPVRGLIWTPFTTFDQLEVRGAIAAITTQEFDFDWRLSPTLDPTSLAQELRDRETLVMVQQERDPDVSFGARGRELGPVLEDFARRGGTVIFLKQIGTVRDFLPATGLLDVTELGSEFNSECTVALPGHPLVNQLPQTFSTAAATSWYSVNSQDADVYVTRGGAAMAIGRDLGDGRVILIGSDYRDYTPESGQLLANAVRMRRFTESTPFVRGDANADARVDITDVIFIVGSLFLGTADPSCLDAADVNDSATLGAPRPPVDISDAIYLIEWLFLGGRAPPAPTPVNILSVAESCGVEERVRDGLGCQNYSPCRGE